MPAAPQRRGPDIPPYAWEIRPTTRDGTTWAAHSPIYVGYPAHDACAQLWPAAAAGRRSEAKLRGADLRRLGPPLAALGDLVHELGLGQPQVSKHLRVLREVGLVDVRDDGRRRLYRLNGQALKPIHDWVKGYERLWSERFELLDDVLEDLKKEQRDGSGK